MTKRLLAIMLAVAMVLGMVPMAAFAAEEDLGISDFAYIQNVNLGFHCRSDGGSGGPAQKIANYSRGDETFGQVATNEWLLLKVIGSDAFGNPIYSLDTDYVCPNCGSSRWVSYSNQSDMLGGAFDGKNMQINHYGGDGGGLVDHGFIDIEKTVDGVNIMAWANSNQDYLSNLIAFNIYKVNAVGGSIEGLSPINNTPIEVSPSGHVVFGGLADGVYAVQEILTAAGKLVFEEHGLVYVEIRNGIQVSDGGAVVPIAPVAPYAVNDPSALGFYNEEGVRNPYLYKTVTVETTLTNDEIGSRNKVGENITRQLVTDAEGKEFDAFCGDYIITAWNGANITKEYELDINDGGLSQEQIAKLVAIFNYVDGLYADGFENDDAYVLAQMMAWVVIHDESHWTNTTDGWMYNNGAWTEILINTVIKEFLPTDDGEYTRVNDGLIAAANAFIADPSAVYAATGKYTGIVWLSSEEFQPILIPITSGGGGGDISFDNKEKLVSLGAIDLEKTVDGVKIRAWLENYNSTHNETYAIGDLIDCFNLYKVNADGAPINGLLPLRCINGDELELTGVIFFGGLGDGWYAIDEVLTDVGKTVFEQAPVMYILIENSITYGGAAKIDFDYDAFYTIVNGYGGGYTLGYPGLNNSGDIFAISVTNTATGKVYPSFCAEAGSRAFAGESGLGCSGYLVAEKFADYAKFAAAYNYIEANYGKLEDVRAITQIVTWYLLGAIDVPSANFDNINWGAIEAGSSGVIGIAGAKAIVEDVLANYSANVVKGDIVDVVYMLCELGHDSHDCQPQLVPVYGERGGFDNTGRIKRFGSVTFDKEALGVNGEYVSAEVDAFEFKLFKADELGAFSIEIGTFKTELGGIIYVDELDAGVYKFVEVTKEGWTLANYPDGIFFELADKGGANLDIVWITPLTDKNDDGNPVVRNDPTKGGVIVTADVVENFEKITLQDVYSRNVQQFFERNVQQFFVRDVKQMFEREIRQYFERDVKQMFEREIQQYYERDVKQMYERTVQQNFERDIQQVFEREIQQNFEREVQQFFERDIQQYFERSVQQFFERDIQQYFERDVQQNYEREIQQYYERSVQQFFEREIQQRFEREVKQYFEREIQQFFERDVKQYFEREIQQFFEREAKQYFRRDVQEFFERSAQEFFERDVQEFFERSAQEFFKRDVQDFFERTVQQFFERDVQEFFERSAQEFYERNKQDRYVPVFKKDVSSKNGTMVTWRDSGKIPGGTFGNGMTFLTLDLDAARSAEGVTFRIADSSPSNRPIDYYYTVRAVGNELVLSLDNLISASVTLKAYSTPPDKHDPSHHVTLTGNQVLRVPLPAASSGGNSGNSGIGSYSGLNVSTSVSGNNLNSGTLTITIKDTAGAVVAKADFAKPGNSSKDFKVGEYTVNVQFSGQSVKSATISAGPAVGPEPGEEPVTGSGVVYIFVHFDGLNWFTTGEYEFVRWQYLDTITGEYELVETKFGDYVLQKTVYGDYSLKDTVYGDYEKKNTVYGEYESQGVVYGPYESKDVKYGGYESKGVKYGEYGSIDVVYGEYELKDTKYGEYGLKDTVTGEYELIKTETGEYKLKDTKTGDYVLKDTIYGGYDEKDPVIGEYELKNTKTGEYELKDTKTGEYVLKDTTYGEYGLKDTVYGEYGLKETKYGEYGLIKTETGEYELKDTKYGEYGLKDTVTGEYELKDTKYGEYVLKDTVTGEYELKNTIYGEYELAKTDTGEYVLKDTVRGEYVEKDPVIGEYVLKDTVFGEYEPEKTVTGEYVLKDTNYSAYTLVEKDKEISRTSATRPYTGNDLKLTVDGVIKPLGVEFELAPGEHEFVLTFADREVKQKWTVIAGQSNSFAFGTQYIDGEDEITRLEPDYSDNWLEPDYKDVWLEPDYKDNWVTPGYNDVWLTPEYKDNWVAPEYKDVWLTPKYSDNWLTPGYTDVWLEPIYKDNWVAADYKDVWLTPIYNDVWVAADYKDNWLAPIYSDTWLEPNYKDNWPTPIYSDNWVTPDYKDVWLTPDYKDIWLAPDYKDVWVEPEYKDIWVTPDYKDNWLEPDYKDNWLAPDYSDDWLDPDYKDNWVAPDYSDNWLAPDYSDNWLAPDYSDTWLDPDYKDVWLAPDYKDIWLAPDYKDNWLDPDYKDNWLAPDYKNVWLAPNYKDHWLPDQYLGCADITGDPRVDCHLCDECRAAGAIALN